MFFSDSVSSETQCLIEESILRKHYRRGEIIYQQGVEAAGLYYLVHGLVGLSFSSEKGTEHLLRLFRPGQNFGHRSFLACEAYHATATCLEDSEVCWLPSHAVWGLLEREWDVMRQACRVLAEELRRSELQRISITDQDVLSRTAEALVYLKDVHPDHLWTRKEIADFCGSTTPTIIRTLARLEKMGLIQQTGRHIEISRRDALLDLDSHGLTP